MSLPFDITPNLDGFSGQAPIFPLPGAVLFPHLLLPLQMFEPRYRKMTEDALAGERLLTIAMLKPGFESQYESKHAPMFPHVCLGRIINEERLPDGRYFLVLRGLSRAIVEEEIETDEPYRVGKLKLLADEIPTDNQFSPSHCRAEIAKVLQRVPTSRIASEVRDEILNPELPLGTVCDLVAYVLTLPSPTMREVSQTLNVQTRYEIVLKHLWNATREFPPRFSIN